MIETPNPEIDVDQLMEEIRAEVLRGGGPANSPGGGAASVPSKPVGEGRWFALLGQLHVAEQNAVVGVATPAFTRYGRLKRRIARTAARAVLYLAEVITHHQRAFNVSSIAALRLLTEQAAPRARWR